MSEKHLLEGEDGRLNEARLVRRQVRRQVRVGRRPCRGVLLRDHLDLLPDSALHDDVVTLEPEFHTFSVEDLIPHVRLNQVAQLGGGRFAAFRRDMLCHEVVDHALGDDDAGPAGIAGRHPSIRAEKRDADQQEVQHRLGEKFSNAHTGYFGEYQIGDVNARSCVVIGTFGSVILILKYAAS